MVLLDSGIDLENSVFRGKTIVQYKQLDGAWKRADGYTPLHGHGTGVASIMLKQCEYIELISFVLFTDKLCVKVDKLVHALEKISEDIPCDIVHMSLGVRYFYPALRKACERLSSKGVILVSACHNNGGISFPAAFPSVIGVDASWKCLKADDFVYVEDGTVVNLKAKGGNQRIAWLRNTYVINRGSSFAAAYVTAKISEVLLQGGEPHKVLEHFRNIARHVIAFSDEKEVYEKPGRIKRALVFPYNKETSSLLRYAELLPFTIIDVYDCRLSGKLSKQIVAGDDKIYYIKNIENCLWKGFDTLILGHIRDLERLSQREWKNELLSQCLEHKINVFSFDEEGMEKWKFRFNQAGLWLYYPKLNGNLPEKRQFGKMFAIRTPVLGVLGTSNQQGKFTLQLGLRKHFLRDGYRLCQLGSEPESLLFEMDEVFPFGFESNIKLDTRKYITYLNSCMSSMDQQNPNIIIVGSQAGTIPMQWDHIDNYPLDRICFLLGTLPDGVLLCVNYHDKISEIQRCILAIESLSKSKVIACSLFPLGYCTEWDIVKGVKKLVDDVELQRVRDEIQEVTQRPCCILNNKGIENLYQISLAFFSSK